MALRDARPNPGVVTRTVEQTRAEACDRRLAARGVNVAPSRGASVEPGAVKAPASLGWNEFSGRCFPGHRRHDLAVLLAYQQYLSDSSRVPAAPLATPAPAGGLAPGPATQE